MLLFNSSRNFVFEDQLQQIRGEIYEIVDFTDWRNISLTKVQETRFNKGQTFLSNTSLALLYLQYRCGIGKLAPREFHSALHNP